MTLLLTPEQIEFAKHLASRQGENRLPEGIGFLVAMMVGTAIWLVIGIVLYFLMEGVK